MRHALAEPAETGPTHARARVALVAAFVALALGPAACGGPGDGADAADQAATETAPAGEEGAEAPAAASADEAARAPAEEPAASTSAETAEPASGSGSGSRGGTSRRRPASPSPDRPAPGDGATETAAPPREPEPEPEPEPAPQPRMATLEPGATIRATLDQELSTEKNRVGDTFTAAVSSAVAREGEVVIPAGARLEGEVTAVQKSGKSGQAAVLKLNFSRVSFRGQTYPVSLAITEAKPEAKSRTTTGEAAGRIGIGAAAGAVLGRVIGGDAKGTLIGAAVGAAAGTAVVLTTGDADAVLPAGAPMTLRLEEPLVVRLPDA